jgi:hypothetical protein
MPACNLACWAPAARRGLGWPTPEARPNSRILLKAKSRAITQLPSIIAISRRAGRDLDTQRVMRERIGNIWDEAPNNGAVKGENAMRPWRIFYSYSHLDAGLHEELGKYLAPLRRHNKIEEWHDRKIEPGANWDIEISSQLESAHLILLLLSADFLNSEY